MIVTTCCECRDIIRDEYIFKVLDRNWHASCLRCCLCKSVLRDRCYAKDEQVYCKDDFYRTLTVVCAGCGLKIEPKDFVRKARHNIYHVNCFSCAICGKLLNTGEELYPMENGKIICKKDAIAKEKNINNSGAGKHCFEAHNSALICEVESKSFKQSSGLTASRDDLMMIEMTESQVKNKEHPGVPSTFDHLDEKHKTSTFDANLNENSLEELFQMNNMSDGSTGSNTDVDGPSQIAKSTNCPGLTPTHPANLSAESAESSDEDKDNNNDKTTEDANKDEIESETGGLIQNGVGAKRRGPRTTIKAKQLETLKSAFAATPKPTRHIREQLAQDTGLNMRVIQVWFQNRRSKERRLKQMTVIGARRPYYRNTRRVRVLRGEEDAIIQHGDHTLSYQGYYQDSMEHFYHTFQSNLYTPDYLMTLDQHTLQQFHQQDLKQQVANQSQLVLRHPMVVSSNQKMPDLIGNFKSDKEAPMIRDFQEFYSEQNPNQSDEQLVRSVEDVKKSGTETRTVDSRNGFMTPELQTGKAKEIEDARMGDMVYEDNSQNMSRCHQSFGDLFGGNAFDHMINVSSNPQHSQEALIIRSW